MDTSQLIFLQVEIDPFRDLPEPTPPHPYEREPIKERRHKKQTDLEKRKPKKK